MRFPQDVPTLTDGVVTLRSHREDDIPAVLEQCLDPESVRWTSIPQPYAWDDAQRFVRHFVPLGWQDEQSFDFAIEVDGRFAGTCALRAHPDRCAEVGYIAHPWVRGRGMMQRALRLLLDWGFASRGFETVSWWAQAGNWPSRRLAWHLGFTCHGPIPAWLPQRGSLKDCWLGVLGRADAREPRQPWYDAPRITGSVSVLRPVEHRDAERLVEAFTDETSLDWLRMPTPYDLAKAHTYVEERRELMASGKVVYWAVADPDSDDLLGAVVLFDLEPGVDAELGYFAHPAARGRGITTEACRLAVRHGFVPEEDGGLGLTRVTAYAGTANAASLRVIERLGFTRYGVERRGGSNSRGQVFDLACHDLLLEEWRG